MDLIEFLNDNLIYFKFWDEETFKGKLDSLKNSNIYKEKLALYEKVFFELLSKDQQYLIFNIKSFMKSVIDQRIKTYLIFGTIIAKWYKSETIKDYYKLDNFIHQIIDEEEILAFAFMPIADLSLIMGKNSNSFNKQITKLNNKINSLQNQISELRIKLDNNSRIRNKFFKEIKIAVEELIEEEGGITKTAVAEKLEMKRTTFNDHLKKHNIIFQKENQRFLMNDLDKVLE